MVPAPFIVVVDANVLFPLTLRMTMERFFPEAMVTGDEPLIGAMQNDLKDRHVVAAAVKAGAQVVITANLKDFTPLPDGIEAQSPDEFLENLFDLDPDGFIEMLCEQASDLQKPPVTFDELLDRLAADGAGSCHRRQEAPRVQRRRVDDNDRHVDANSSGALRPMRGKPA